MDLLKLGGDILTRVVDAALKLRPGDKNDINFLLFSNSSNKYEFTELILDGKDSILQLGFDPKKKTKLLVHGFYSHAFAEFPRKLKDAYLETYKDEEKSNVICVNWSSLSGLIIDIQLGIVRTKLENVSKAISDFLIALEERVKADLSNVHLVGHAVGAHICGLVAAAVLAKKGKKIGRISALDAACACFKGWAVDQISVEKTGADFVDAYNSGSQAPSHPSHGHVDFFIKAGRQQANSNKDDTATSCIHEEAHRFFCQTILDGPGKKIVVNQSSTSQRGQASASSSTQEPIIPGEFCSPGTTGHYEINYGANKKGGISDTDKSQPSKKRFKPNPPAAGGSE